MIIPCNNYSRVLLTFPRHQTERLLFSKDLWIHICRGHAEGGQWQIGFLYQRVQSKKIQRGFI